MIGYNGRILCVNLTTGQCTADEPPEDYYRCSIRWGYGVSFTITLGLCLLVPWDYKQIEDIIEGVTGWTVSHWRLMKAAERGMTLARIFNLREGLSADDDKLPHRFATSPATGPLKDVAIEPEKLTQAQQAYYQVLGWDLHGIPTQGRLVELDIEWAADYLD